MCTSHQYPSPLQPTYSHHRLRIWHSWESEVRCSWASEVPLSPRQLVSTRWRGTSDQHRFVPAFPHGTPRSPPTSRSEFTRHRWSREDNSTAEPATGTTTISSLLVSDVAAWPPFFRLLLLLLCLCLQALPFSRTNSVGFQVATC